MNNSASTEVKGKAIFYLNIDLELPEHSSSSTTSSTWSPVCAYPSPSIVEDPLVAKACEGVRMHFPGNTELFQGQIKCRCTPSGVIQRKRRGIGLLQYNSQLSGATVPTDQLSLPPHHRHPTLLKLNYKIHDD